MASEKVKHQRNKVETRLTVGWQRLTREEFLEALTVALLEKLRSRETALAEDPASAPSAAAR
jgi:hypothetical protein